MNARNTRTEIETRLLAGETVEAIAEDLRLDVVEDETGTPMVALPGWVADDGNCECPSEYAGSGKEAAEEYVSDGDWGDDSSSTWVTVYTWRRGLRLEAVECAYCCAPATAHDAEGDPACEDHADAVADGAERKPLVAVIEADTDREWHKVEIEPEVPECVDGQEHDWASPHEIVGGIEENPGVWGHGGGIISHSVCLRCGCGRTYDTWAQDPTDGQQGLTSTSYEAGEYSADLAERRDRLVREALDDIIEVRVRASGELWRTSIEYAPDEDGTDEDADDLLEQIRDAVGGACDVEWTGDGNTGRDGVNYTDVSIEWREGVTARRKALARAKQEAQ